MASRAAQQRVFRQAACRVLSALMPTFATKGVGPKHLDNAHGWILYNCGDVTLYNPMGLDGIKRRRRTKRSR